MGLLQPSLFQVISFPRTGSIRAAKAIEDLIPAPNFGAPGALARNYTRSAATPSNQGNYDARIDHNFSSSSTIYLRFSGGNAWSSNPRTLPPPLGGTTGVNRPRNASINFATSSLPRL